MLIIDNITRTSRTATHLFFWGSIYSQWHLSAFEEDGVAYNCAEQYMMAKKALHFGDSETHAKIMKVQSPHAQKVLGRVVAPFDPVAWDEACLDYVTQASVLKFSQNADLGAALLATDDLILVEGSPDDVVWGVGLKWTDPAITDPTNWRGRNLLGQALMRAREILREKK